MGNDCQIFSGVSFGSEPYLISLGNKVKIVGETTFITHDGGVEVLRNLYNLPKIDFFGKITIGNNVFIGYRCTILPGVNIGDNCIIGAGSVVTRSIPANSVAAGVPAHVIKDISSYYQKHKDYFENTKNYSKKEKKEYLVKKYF